MKVKFGKLFGWIVLDIFVVGVVKEVFLMMMSTSSIYLLIFLTLLPPIILLIFPF